MTMPWIVAGLLVLLGSNTLVGIWLTERLRRPVQQADRALTDSGQALGGFKDLVNEIQEERDALKRECAALRDELAALKKGAAP